MTVIYRVAHDNDDLERVIDLEIAVWGIHERDAFPVHMLRLARLHGGAVIVAERDGDIIGLNIGFPARRGTETVLWSYVTGVHPSIQGENIGYQLKQAQRRWARNQGYATVCWTFDPLQPKNANFNLNRLGTVVYAYHPDLYGPMQDQINQSNLPSDRLEVRWNTAPIKRVPSPPPPATSWLLDQEGHYNPDALQANRPVGVCLSRHQNEKRRWQPLLRTAFQYALARGYLGTHFVRGADASYYVLMPASA